MGIIEGILGIIVLIVWFIWFVLKSGYKFTVFTKNKIEERIDEAKLDAYREEHNEQYTGLLLDLRSEPETQKKVIKERYPLLSKEDIYEVAIQIFKSFLSNGNFVDAKKINDYHQMDSHDLLSVMMALEAYETSGGLLDLKINSYKISLLENETAYEKLPCNWQKIHTFLAPMEDEIVQADILDSGNIYITDQRIFFVGKKGSETVNLNDIAYMDHKEDALQFFRDEGLSEIFAFPTPHHATYARLVIEELMGR